VIIKQVGESLQIGHKSPIFYL